MLELARAQAHFAHKANAAWKQVGWGSALLDLVHEGYNLFRWRIGEATSELIFPQPQKVLQVVFPLSRNDPGRLFQGPVFCV